MSGRIGWHLWIGVLVILGSGFTRSSEAASCNVPSGSGCSTIQAALNQAGPGDTISVSAGTFHEKVSFTASGSAGGGYITLQGAPGFGSILDGTGVSGSNMVLIDGRSYVKVIGFEIRNNLGVSDGSGIRVQGSGSHIELRANRIHEIRGHDAMGITVYGTDAASISNLVIDNNEIYDCDPAQSEALTLNGNVEQFEVTNNLVRDVNNIGIDFIGGETDIQPDPEKVTRNGVCRGNQVYRARSIYGGGFAGAIYVDGGRDILIERNITSESDLGLEVGAENAGTITRNITVRDNVIYRNDKVGIVFGGFDASVGRVKDCTFTNNTLFDNDTLQTGVGELWIQFAENNVVRNNLFFGRQQTLLYSENGNVGNQLDYNLWFTDGGAPVFVWSGTAYSSLGAWQAGASQEAHGLYADPLFVGAETNDFHLRSVSPAVNLGDPSFVPGIGETDLDDSTRVSGGRVDIGADELTCGDGVVDAGEACDDHNSIDCDGCDSNCTPTTQCGNGILCGAEACDDGNNVDGDCCSLACAFEAAASPCFDGDLCTNGDACDGAGTCVGMAAPSLTCKAGGAGRSSLLAKDSVNAVADSLTWKWSKGEATSAAEFGDPTTTTSFALCVYDHSSNLQPLLAATISPSASVWGSTRSGYRYNDRTASSGGIRSIKLMAGEASRSSAKVQGKGSGLTLPPLAWTPPVTVQLRNLEGGCWGATFSNPKRNDSGMFKAASD